VPATGFEVKGLNSELSVNSFYFIIFNLFHLFKVTFLVFAKVYFAK
jgi:hypothetical protein